MAKVRNFSENNRRMKQNAYKTDRNGNVVLDQNGNPQYLSDFARGRAAGQNDVMAMTAINVAKANGSYVSKTRRPRTATKQNYIDYDPSRYN
ncbi:MAG: hypothetical protein FWE36_05135 [Erysipelotrichales bacterium]|nr:hypothetical protein [Erysipelotrichales bacterium]